MEIGGIVQFGAGICVYLDGQQRGFSSTEYIHLGKTRGCSDKQTNGCDANQVCAILL